MFNIPNLLTMFRLVLVPVFLACYLMGQTGWAVAAFAVASVTDLFDGMLARLLHQQTKLGALLDPAADKALGFAALLALVLKGRLPAWFLGLTIFRDAIVILLALRARQAGVTAMASPSKVGKYATFFTNLVVVVALAREISYAPALDGYLAAVIIAAGQCVLVATVQYLVRFPGMMRLVPKPTA